MYNLLIAADNDNNLLLNNESVILLRFFAIDLYKLYLFLLFFIENVGKIWYSVYSDERCKS